MRVSVTGVRPASCDRVDRVDQAAVARATADVAGELLPDLDLGRLGVAIEQIVGGDDQARRAEAALHGTGLDERTLHVARRAGLGEPLDRDDRLIEGAGGSGQQQMMPTEGKK